MRNIRSALSLVLVLIALTSAGVARSKSLRTEHTVSLTDPAKQEFHVATVFSGLDQPRLELSLPVWTPGWYTVENYFKNVLRFRITDAAGHNLPHTMVHKQTWLVDTAGLKEVRVEYDYRATVLALNQAKITPDYAFFTGTELFLEPVGHRTEPATVHFRVPDGWRIATALKETADPLTFTAEDYDALVDAPVEMGKFDELRFEVEGKPHILITTPAGAFSRQSARQLSESLTKLAHTDSSIFGGLPYDKYVYFYFFIPPESNASGALEHLNAFVSFASPANVEHPERLVGTAAHEFFHLWNVKRIRPAEMWPYDYSREDETPLLWVSEGFTNYYGEVTAYRAGLRTEEEFLLHAASVPEWVEANEGHNYVSLAESSMSTWVGYDTPVAMPTSYYTQGEYAAALLDLSILNDTGGRMRLDDVMRALFNENYKRGRGFTSDELIAIISRITGRDYRDFFRRYIFGTETPDHDQFYDYAGYKIVSSLRQNAALGVSGRYRNGGYAINSVEPGSAAAAAGIMAGDVIMNIDGQTMIGFQMSEIAGKTVKVTLMRDGVEMKLPVKVGVRETREYSLVPVDSPTKQQLTVRSAWLKR